MYVCIGGGQGKAESKPMAATKPHLGASPLAAIPALLLPVLPQVSANILTDAHIKGLVQQLISVKRRADNKDM